MQFDEMINTITPEAYQNLKRAVELGKWPDGERLSKDQREQCMQAVIAYDAKHLSEDERVGQIDMGKKEEGEVCDSHDHNTPDTSASDISPVKIIKS
ncbi:MAG: hypothetical protein COA99_05020 [Moraxellaceae bacterium]|nr:MAG: hypothetical protein COA99_05020 [Moraxellaceae bacterium]